MKRFFMTTAIVGLTALPTLAVAQSDQSTDPIPQAQTDPQGEQGDASGAGSSLPDGGQTDTDGTSSQSGTRGSGTGGTPDGTASDGDAGTSGTGTASGGMMSDDTPAVAAGHSAVDPGTVEAREIESATVVSQDGDPIADVSEVLVTEDGSIDAIVVNVGGFLGIGSKQVEVPFDSVTLQTNDDDGDMSVIIPMSQQELEDMPPYDAG